MKLDRENEMPLHALCRFLSALGIFLLSVLSAFAAGQAAAPSIIPHPVKMEAGEGAFTFTAETAIAADEASRGTARQLSDFLEPMMGRRMKIVAFSENAENVIGLTQDAGLAGLGAEGYRLEVLRKRIGLNAPTQAGLFYAVQTFRQLLPPQALSATAAKDAAWKVDCVKIEDYPRFGWRGLLLDSGHDFQNLPFVLRFIDLMAIYKFNTLHWHLTDRGDWSIEIKKYPKLLDPATHEEGVKPGYYTQEQIRQVVQYAAARHITIVPEIDMPGHSAPALLAYPGLNCPIPQKGRPWQYCLGNEKTYEFLENVLSEVIDLFRRSSFTSGATNAPRLAGRIVRSARPR